MGPMGIGVLYGRRELLEKMPPFLTGGEMIENVTLKGVTYAQIPHKFEAGTVNAAGAYGLAAAIRYIKDIGFDEIRRTEDELCERIFEGLSKSPHIHIQGSKDPKKHNGIVSFTIDDVHPHDIASILVPSLSWTFSGCSPPPEPVFICIMTNRMWQLLLKKP